MSKYFIGEVGFKTKKACKEYASTKIYARGVCTIGKDDPDFEFFVDLLCNHPHQVEKIGAGIESFYLKPTFFNKNALETNITRIDGSEEVFSWKKCTNFSPESPFHKLIRAMRESVSPFILKFRGMSEMRCILCSVTEAKFHVDHVDPPFRDLVTTFISQNPHLHPPSRFVKKEVTYQLRFLSQDSEFEEKWIAFHNERCTLQILCDACNQHKH